jgi:cyclophilin family peptidyl-prolyl cis-trans isomerase
MMMHSLRTTAQRAVLLALAFALSSVPSISTATVVRFQTSSGNILVRLFNQATPLSVANFMNYATSDRYDGTFIHRVPQSQSPPYGTSNFVVQGGGFKLNNSIFQATGITTDPPVTNEPGISNLRGTLSYAKGSGVNSATSQWFFNVGNNSFLDTPANNLFTAFGRVVGNGMTVVDAINNLSVVNASSAKNGPGEDFDEIPVRDIDKVIQQQDITANEAVMVLSIDAINVPAGDYNFDGKVDNADLAVWKADLGSTLKAEADGNGDGTVDGRDFLVWQRTLGRTLGLQERPRSGPPLNPPRRRWPSADLCCAPCAADGAKETCDLANCRTAALIYVVRVRLELKLFKHWRDLWILHEAFPRQTRACVFNHYDNLSLVQAHVNFVVPAFGLVEAVMKSINAPGLGAKVAVEVNQRGHRFLGRKRKHAQCG